MNGEEAMEAKLVVVGGKANRSEVKLKLPAMLGRGRDVDVTVAHAMVSRHHCLIYELDGALVVRDNGSLNGTLVDGKRIKEALLKPENACSSTSVIRLSIVARRLFGKIWRLFPPL